jgi:type III restriction enzyme
MADETPKQAVENPILSSPYDEPTAHWSYKSDGTPEQIPGRRPACYWFQTKDAKHHGSQADLFAEEDRDELDLVNRLRQDVRNWGKSKYRGGTTVTRELFEWWIREDAPRRLFFCQREAVETIIYLLEIAIPKRLRATGRKAFQVSDEDIEKLLNGERPSFYEVNNENYPRLIEQWDKDEELFALRRMACKMATGSGKTVVMAMLITWAFCNRGRNPGSTHFPKGILVCAPNLTVRKRLQVLRPDEPNNYYDEFDLVPPKYRELLNSGKVLVVNWHGFLPKGANVEGGVSYKVVDKGDETDDAFTIDRLGELATLLPILILNDEGHHCWQGRAETDEEINTALKDSEWELGTEDKKELKKAAVNARVWLAGLKRINNSGLLKDSSGKLLPGVITCVDLSATPFYLSNSGFPEGSPFPWIVNDFGLVDAIESGITKIPRLPIKDDTGQTDEAGRPDPEFYRLWDNVKSKMTPADFITKSKPKPESIYKYAEPALTTLASQWHKQFKEHLEKADGKPFIPPALIVVCNDTQVSEVFFQNISGEEKYEDVDEKGKTVQKTRYNPSKVFPEFCNSSTDQHCIRIDSKLLAKLETEGGESKDQAALRLRELIDTVGKRGGSGEQIRCVTSVSMLTEGWDANNVTHILGVRAFGSQLLCEQVVGRGLRRMSYDINPATGMLNEEYVDVYGIPFSLIPFKGNSSSTPKADPVHVSVYAVDERASFEIRLPNVEGYVYSIRESGISCDVDQLEEIVLSKVPTQTFLAPPKGYMDQPVAAAGSSVFVTHDSEEYFKTIRLGQIAFMLTRAIVEDLVSKAENVKRIGAKARHLLFPEVLAIVRKYIARKVVTRGGIDKRALAHEQFSQLAIERIREGIVPVAAESSTLMPVINSFQPHASTINVNYQTTKRTRPLVKSHLNRAVVDSSLETDAIEIFEMADCVECFTPNDRQIGLIINYEHQGSSYNYEPDFVVRLQNDDYVLIEIKGMGGIIHGEDKVKAKNAAAKKWVAAVNNFKRYGDWHFLYCEDQNMVNLKADLEKLSGITAAFRPFERAAPSSMTPWSDCLPLLPLTAVSDKIANLQPSLNPADDWSSEWVRWEGMPPLSEGMFVIRCLGSSIEPDIPEGAYCVFDSNEQDPVGKTVLVDCPSLYDPVTGTGVSIAVCESVTEVTGSEGPDHFRVVLTWPNADVGRREVEVPNSEGFMLGGLVTVLQVQEDVAGLEALGA